MAAVNYAWMPGFLLGGLHSFTGCSTGSPRLGGLGSIPVALVPVGGGFIPLKDPRAVQAALLRGSASSSSGGHRAQRGSPPGCRQRRCQQCSYTTQCPSKLRRHQRIHTGERPFQCSHCGKAFIEKGNLVTHLRVHTGERPFLCHLCPSAFTQINALVGHVRSHTGERPFHCRFCPEAFKHRPQKRAHEQKAHNHHK